MPTVALFKQDSTHNGDVQLNDAVFGIEPNNNVVFDAVIMQRASLRQGTHAVKNRSAVRGGGKRVQVVLVKAPSVHHNGVVVVLFSVLHHAHTHTSFHARFVVWQSSPSFLKRSWTTAWLLLML